MALATELCARPAHREPSADYDGSNTTSSNEGDFAVTKLRAFRKRPPWLDRVAEIAAELGPYLAIELVLPGGSLLALLLWFHRRMHRSRLTAHIQTTQPHSNKRDRHGAKV